LKALIASRYIQGQFPNGLSVQAAGTTLPS